MYSYGLGRFLLLFLLVGCLLLLSGCATTAPMVPVGVPSVQALQAHITETPLERVVVIDKTQHSTVGWSGLKVTLEEIRLSKEDLEAVIRETLKRANLFGPGSGPGMVLNAEVLEIFEMGKYSINDVYQVTLRYRLNAADGKVVYDETLQGLGRMSPEEGSMGWGIYNPRKAMQANLVELVTRLPNALNAYARGEKEEQRYLARIRDELKREDRYSRVISSQAVVRSKPDANSREVSSLPQAELVHVTGSLPSGWVQVSREGKPVGWVHSSLLREDQGAISSGRTPSLSGKEIPKIAVWDLWAREVKTAYAQELTSILVSEISKLGRYEVYSQDHVRTLAGWTAERMQMGCTDTKCLTALGQMDVSKLISGSVGKIGDTYSISLNLFDTQNAKAMNAISEFCRSENELIGIVQQAIKRLLAGPP